MTPPTAAARASATPAAPTGSFDAAFDELVAQLNDSVELLTEVEYRAVLVTMVAAIDDRPRVDLASEQLALSLSDYRAGAEALERVVQRIGVAFNLASRDRQLALLAVRLPEPWRTQVNIGAQRLVERYTQSKATIAKAQGVTRANQLLVEASIDAALGHPKHAQCVTYDNKPNRVNVARLADGRA